MDSFRHVLVPIDFSGCSTAALSFAGALTTPAVPMTLVHVHPFALLAGGETLYPAPTPAFDPETQADLEARLEALAVPLRKAGRTVDVRVCEGATSPEILACAQACRADLIVMGTHGRHGIDRLIAGGSVTEEVAARATCSVVSVRSPASSPPAMANILCAVDLTPWSHETVQGAVALARSRGARLTVLHVAEVWHWEDPWPIARGDEGEVRRLLAESLDDQLAKLVARYAPGSVEALVRFGTPKDEILRVAREREVDLVVLGAHSRGLMERLFFGSTAQRVLTACARPVLVLRPPVMGEGVPALAAAETVGHT